MQRKTFAITTMVYILIYIMINLNKIYSFFLILQIFQETFEL